jgi:hypothetical protein
MVQVSAFPGRYDQMAGRARAALNSIMAIVAGAVSKVGAGVAKQAGNVVGKVHGLKFDNGGYIPPNSFAYNGGSVPELALNAAQGDALRKKIEGIGSGGNVIKVYIDGVEVAQRRVTVEEIDKNNHALFEHITKL